jgi:hypothetical protein
MNLNLPDGLTKQHIVDAVNRGDHQMIYRGATINVDELMKMIVESEKPIEDVKKDDRGGRIRRISEQSEEIK